MYNNSLNIREIALILKATDEQFTLSPNGELLWQDKVGSPLPGAPVATLSKSEAILAPSVTPIDDAVALAGVDAAEAQAVLERAVTAQIAKILEPLVALKTAGDVDGVTDSVRGIYDDVYAALGILPREALASHIAGLDTDTRRFVRQAGIKLGPVLVFMPALNKPAAVKLRALLWALYNDKALPVITPRDGVVSQKPEDENPDPAFYQAIGYPLYGARAVRIDMLDRVISAVYDSADKGKFMAQHQMAEWLGCSIPDLYAVLEAMGHVKVHDPADAPAQEEKIEANAEKPVAPVDAVAEETKAEETPEEKPEEKPAEQAKPELATFRLKRGKANQSAQAPRAPKADKKPKKDRSEKRKQQKNRADNKRRVMSAGTFQAKPEDSPFAALADLKAQMGEKK